MSEIRDVMTADVISFQLDTPIESAVRTLIDKHISGAPVVDADNRIVGVVTEADLLSLFWEKQASTVADIMTKSPFSFPVAGPLVDVVDCLMTHSFRRVLIHDGQGKLVGLVSRADLMPAVLDEIIRRRAR